MTGHGAAFAVQFPAAPCRDTPVFTSFANAYSSFGARRTRRYDGGEPFPDKVHAMSESSCFNPRVVEPVAADQPDGLGLAVELWLSRPVDGIAGRSLRIHLRSGARMDQAETLRDLLHAVGTDIVVR
jgi:hypothetical protein